MQICREEVVRYLAREKDEEALLDFITKSFVFNESDTEQELEEAEPAVEEDKEGHDIEEEEDEEEEEEEEEFVMPPNVKWTIDLYQPCTIIDARTGEVWKERMHDTFFFYK